MHEVFIDFETLNVTKGIDVGTYEYARTCEDVLLATWAIEDGPVQIWDKAMGYVMPGELHEILTTPARFSLTAHHAAFDRTIAREVLGYDTPIESWDCTMVQAYLHALPGALEHLAQVLKVGSSMEKLIDGKKLIRMFTMLQPANQKIRRRDHKTNPVEWERFKEYAIRDIEAMRACKRKMPSINYTGRGVAGYHLDQVINQRGFAVDRELVQAGANAAEIEKAALAAEFAETIGGDLRPTQREKFKEHLNATYDLGLENTKAETFNEIMDTDPTLDPTARKLMELALMSNKTSTAKYKKLLPAISPDDRFRGGLQYAGASRTRRWAGRVFQPQNLPSRGLPPQEQTDLYIEALKSGVQDVLFDDLMLFGSASLRGVVVAPDGRKLVVSDLSNIEGRANAWLAGERWKLKAFNEFDAGRGPDLYNVTAGSIIGQNPYDINKTDRNIFGKIPELALGYQSGFGGLQQFARAYGVALADYWDVIQQNIHPEIITAAKTNWHVWGRDRIGEGEDAPDSVYDEWVASEAIKLAWRRRHTAIESLWHACEGAAKLAIQNPGKVFKAGRHLKFAVRVFGDRPFLCMRLPTGQFLTYASPLIKDGTIMYSGIMSTASGGPFGKWTKIHTYGGKLVENACQSLSRDILLANMHHAENAGYEIILTVHDEILSETPDTDEFTVDGLSKCLSRPVPGCEGFPLAAAGFETKRYKKD